MKIYRTFALLLALLCLLTVLNGCLRVEAETPPEATYASWNLILVNADSSVPADWEVDLVELQGGERVDRRILEDLQAMFDDCRAAGLLPIVYSGYRSKETQQELYTRKLLRNQLEGNSPMEAERLTRMWVAYPGTSEHQLGIAVDIDSADPQQCSDEAVWQWLMEHCADYGFIHRYPEDKTDITGIGYEPWHFRYVGKEDAQKITERGLTLEEYLQADVRIHTDESWLRRFSVKDDTVELRCHLLLENTSTQTVAIRIWGDFSEDVEGGLLKDAKLEAISAADGSSPTLTVAPGKQEYEIIFRGEFGGTAQKKDRLLPALTILGEQLPAA